MIKPDVMQSIDRFMDQYYDQSKQAGEHLLKCFSAKQGKTQIRNLENAVYTARRFSSIQNFIKNQMGKDSTKNPTWLKPLPGGTTLMGNFLLAQLDVLMEQATTLSENDPENSLEIRLYLARCWAQQVASHYFYCLASGS